MKVLVACEFSGIVMDAFRRRGFDAWSCDIVKRDWTFNKKAIDKEGRYHIQCDLLEQSVEWFRQWDMLLGFPPCTDLCVSGAKHFAEKKRDGRQQKAIDFFMLLAKAPVKYKSIENPIGIMSSVYRKPDQIIQPWMFGHSEVKSTCLWIYGLPFLRATNKVNAKVSYQRGFYDFLWISNKIDLAKSRSVTYSGIADAMAEQWGGYVRRKECIAKSLRLFKDV